MACNDCGCSSLWYSSNSNGCYNPHMSEAQIWGLPSSVLKELAEYVADSDYKKF